MDVAVYRLIDFYILFPHLLKFLEPLPAQLRPYKQILQNIPEPFENLANTKRILFELESLQTVALHNLLATDLIELDTFKSQRLKRTSENLPDELKNALKTSHLANTEWFRMLINEFPNLNLIGKSGLKKRTGLMEFRYDVEPK